MMKSMITGTRINTTLKLSNLLIAFFVVMGTFVASYSAKAHSVAVFIQMGNGTNGGSNGQVRFHALTWHRFTRTSGSMFVNGVQYPFQSVSLGPMPSDYRGVAGCSGWGSYNNNRYTYQSTAWISGINLCNPLNFGMTGYYLEEPDCNLSGSVNVSTPVILQNLTISPGTTFCAGTSYSMSIVASGVNLSYQWQRSMDGSNWSNVGGNSSTYSAGAASVSDNGARFRCVVTSSGTCGSNPSATSNTVQITVTNGTSITSQPVSSLSGCSGTTMSLSVAGAGTNLRYQWEVNSTPIGGATNPTFSFIAGQGIYLNGSTVRCVVSGSCGSATSNSTSLSVTPNTTITSQPSNSTVCEDAATSFNVGAVGANLTYQWQVFRNNTWSNVSNATIPNTVTYSGATSTQLILSGTKSNLSGVQYRCVVSGSCGASQTSGAATLTVNQVPTITSQPVNTTACASNATFTTAATGSSLTYQWQYRADGVAAYQNVSNGASYSGATTNQLTVIAPSVSLDQYRYRVIVTGVCPSNPTTRTGNPAILTVARPAVITVQPSSTTPSVCEAGAVSMTFTATGSNLTYKWQVSNNGTTFTDISSGSSYQNFNTNTLNIVGATNNLNGLIYRGVATGSCGAAANTNNITLTINQIPAVTVQPSNQTACLPATATFGVTAVGYLATYQWQYSTNGGTYTNVTDGFAGGVTYTGATSNSLTISPDASIDQYRYRVRVSGGCGSPVTSDAKILTVHSLPNITTQPIANTAICIFGSGTISLTNTGLGNTYRWQQKSPSGSWTNLNNTTSSTGVSTTGVFTNALVLSRVSEGVDGYLYRCIITPNASCTGASPINSGTVTLTVNRRPAITIQPVNSNNNTFLQNAQYPNQSTITYVYRVTATGSFTNPTNPDFQWRETTNGGRSWRNINGGTSSGTTSYAVTTTSTSPYRSTLEVTMQNPSNDFRNRSGFVYRCLITGICDIVTSNAVKVNPPPKLNRQ
jgi:hypothetical protein